EQGLPKISLIDRAADTAKGRFVYMRNCTTCHAENGTGVLNSTVLNPNQSDSANGYNYPPVMGNTSYNNGAGMYRLIMSTAFIYTKMPYNDAILSLEDAYDVAAYINSRPRSEYAGVSKDYPDLKSKPIDFPFGPYADNFTEEQHKYGPYLPMLKEGE
ncbi:MAG: c-type cytochrome, partial [Ignavibacteria bacterium]|nr:c-type cytochrome [Ignavibacteria bacterium]